MNPTTHRPEDWIAELKKAGWTTPYRTSTVWQSPSGLLFRGPFKAWELMRSHPSLNIKKEECQH